MLTLTQAISRVAARLNKNASDTTVKTRIKNEINDVCQEKWHGYAWSFRWREYPLVLSGQVTTGTMTATLNSQTITASATPFVTGTHEGAWIRFTADTTQAWYRIKTVSSTSVAIIEPAYQGTTGSGKSYQLCTTNYLLPTELSDTGRIKVTYDGRAVQPQHQIMTDGYYQPPLSVGPPWSFALFNTSQVLSTYATGTVTGTINTMTLTGVNTAWLANVQMGDEILINGDTNIYKVQLVNSDTSITLYNNLVVAPAAATYSISRQFGKILRCNPCPDQAYVCFVKGLRAYSPLINDADTNELLLRFPTAVIEGAVWREAGSSPDQREDGYYQRSERLWMIAQGEDEAILPATNYYPIWNPRG